VTNAAHALFAYFLGLESLEPSSARPDAYGPEPAQANLREKLSIYYVTRALEVCYSVVGGSDVIRNVIYLYLFSFSYTVLRYNARFLAQFQIDRNLFSVQTANENGHPTWLFMLEVHVISSEIFNWRMV